MLERGRIVPRGMGGFLNPPEHPEHSFSIETDLQYRPENRGGMCLSTAVSCTWLDELTRKAAKALLNEWEKNKLPLDCSSVQEWIFQVMGYFRGCYRNPNMDTTVQWNVSEVIIDNKRNPLEYQDEHCRVHFIRKYYPEFKLTEYHLLHAKWGK